MSRPTLAFALFLVFSSFASGWWNAPPGTQKVFIRKNVGDPTMGRPAVPIPASTLAKWGAVVVDDRESYMVVQVRSQSTAGLIQDLDKIADNVAVRNDFDIIDFETLPIDSRQPAPTYPSPWSKSATLPPPARDAFLVQFASVPRSEWRAALESSGASVLGTVGQNGYLVIGAADRLGAAAQQLPVQLLRPYQPIHKIRKDLRTAPGAFVDLVAQIADVPESADAISLLKANTLETLRPTEDIGEAFVFRVVYPTAALPALAAQVAIIAMERYDAPVPTGEREAHLIAGDTLVTGTGANQVLKPLPGNYRQWIADKGLSGTPGYKTLVKVGILDTGFDKGSSTDVHPDFKDGATSFVTVWDYTTTQGDDSDCYGHGTHVAGVFVGNTADTGTKDIGSQFGDFNYLMGLGIAPGLPIVSGRVFNYPSGNPPPTGGAFVPQDRVAIYSDLVAKQVRITSNSWNEQQTVSYDTEAQISDKLVRSATGANSGSPMAIYFAAGNHEGIGGPIVQSPGTAKNVVTVSGSESFNPIPVSSYGEPFPETAGTNSDDANDMWKRSAVGPTSGDARIKPDLVAPMTADESCRTRTTVACSVPLGSVGTIIDAPANLHEWSRGTSFAAPVAAGQGALLYTWFVKRTGVAPKPSLLKAMQLNFAYDLHGNQVDETHLLGRPPDDQQGWGKADLSRAFANDGRYDYVNESVVLTQGGQTNTLYTIKDLSRPVRVTLVWTDRFKTPVPTTSAAVNDLNLKVLVGSQFAIGNSTDPSTGRSIIYSSGGTFDTVDNVEEVIFLASDFSGGATQFTVNVFAQSVPADAINVWGGNQINQQDYAVFVDNVTGGANGGLSTPAPSNLVATAAASCVPNQSCTSATLQWTAAPSATNYKIYRRSLATQLFSLVTTVPAQTSFTDNTVQNATTYAYEVTAVIAGAESPPSNVDLATTVAFTDPQDPIGAVTVKADHINQLRTAVNAARAYFSLPAFNGWTDMPIVGGGLNATVVKGDHITELRLHLDEALGPPAIPYTDPGTAPGSLHNVVIKGAHIDELRKRVR